MRATRSCYNKHVASTRLKNKGARFVEELDEVPEGAVTVFSAHGVPLSVVNTAKDRRLFPSWTPPAPWSPRSTTRASVMSPQGRTLILIGHAGHPEVEGTMGQVGAPVTLVQTEDEVAHPGHPVGHAGRLYHPDHAVDRRYASGHHPGAEEALYRYRRPRNLRHLLRHPEPPDLRARAGKLADVILVVGAANSSNSNRLREIGIEEGLPSYLINDGSELKPEWVKGKKVVGLTAGASAPEELVRHVIEALERIEPVTVETMDGKKEHIEFRLPAELRA